jgi:hypothetical protein
MIVSACFQATLASHPLLKLGRPFAQRDSRTELLGERILVLHVTPAQLLTVDVGASFQVSFADRVPAFEGLPRQ